jgi:N-carbamoyl-L-amino-acid hydrolase
MPELSINAERLWDSLMTHGKIGGLENGGVCRETLTPEDIAGRDTFVRWCKEAGLSIGTDALGTIYATRAGTDDSLEPLAIGSHLDTQPSGGKFDGILGVLSGLEVVRALNDAGHQTRRPITIIDWTNEEGSRFPPPMIASGVYAGLLSMDDISGLKDAEGVSFIDALQDSGYAGAETVGDRRFSAYLELHIEQGPVLENAGIEIGVVNGAQAMSWNRIAVHGQEAHAGPTPMAIRLDAMAAAARLITASFDIANSIDNARATVGVIRAEPASHNTIPRRVEFTLDMRHPDDAVLAGMLGELESRMARERSLGFMLQREQFGSAAAVRFDRHCVDTVREVTAELGYSHCDITSGAGHDAVYVSRVVPTAMIFVPCEGGISHNPIENITREQALAGAEVLLGAALRLAD